MAQDPYQVLGVKRGADAAAIRAAYRKLAKRYHPDRNPGDQKAEDTFKASSAAFEILGDKDKRAKFDRGEIDGDGNAKGPFGGANQQYRQGGGPRAGQANGGHGPGGGRGYEDFSDIFSDLFSGGGRGGAAMQGRDVRYRMAVDFLEAASGVTKRVTMPDGRTLDLTIPQGLREGQSLRLRGQGEPGVRGGSAGDVYVDITVKPHRFFKAEGDNVLLDVPISLREAVLGSKITIPTVQGEVTINVPKGASSGTALRLKGKGLKNPKTDKTGDQLARLKIVLPEKSNPALEKFMENWQDEASESPRARLKL